MRDQMGEFEMLLDDVLREVANPEPVEGLKQRVMMQMEMAAAQSSELERMAKSVALFEEKQKQEGVLGSLWSSLQELVWPSKLPPLVLESRPVAVVDRMAAGRSYRSTLWAVGAHALAVLLIGFLVKTHVRFAAPVKAMVVTDLAIPPQAPPKLDKMGGGGGQRGPTPVTKGTPPKFADTQIVPPNKPPLEEPKIHIAPTIEVQQDVKMASSIPQIGIASAPLVGMSMGYGSGTGLGSGNGSGMGPGSGGNTGGGPRRIGGGVSAPVVIYSVEPEFSEEARKAKAAGNVLVNLWVDEKGNPSHVHVIRGVGMGLDEKARDAVLQYKFKPAMENGKPVLVELNVEVKLPDLLKRFFLPGMGWVESKVMSTRVSSYSKINLGLAIGPVRPDGFHGLTTLYQTLDLHDLVTVSAKRLLSGAETRISLTTNHPFVPRDARNTAWRMVERCLERLGLAAEVAIHIEKRLPVQGGMGAGSANAAAALLGLERELGVALPGVERLKLAAEIGSDVPLFLLGGSVLGLGRGELVLPMPDLPRTWCVVAVPQVGVSTPAAFKAWDALVAGKGVDSVGEPMSHKRDIGQSDLVDSSGVEVWAQLTSTPNLDKLQQLSLAYSSLSAKTGDCKPGTSGIVRDPYPEKKRDLPDESWADAMNDLAENTLLALVRTGIGNDFEEVVFPQYPSLRITKRQLMGSDSDGSAIYAALSGSGSALFGLYRSEAEAKAAQQRVQSSGVQALLTETLPRAGYWERMFAE